MDREQQLDPPDPVAALVEPDEFRSHPLVSFSAELMPIRAALTLAPANIHPTPADELPPWRTWFGGNPLARRSATPAWPRNRSGQPLTHVLQVDLASERDNLREALFSLTGLPDGGILQLFHDLSTYGNADDAGSGAWHLRWMEADPDEDDDAEFVLELPPGDAPGPEADEYVEPMPLSLLNTAVVATIPPLLNVRDHLSTAQRNRYHRVQEWLETRTRHLNILEPDQDVVDESTPWDDGFDPVDPATRMGGFGFVEENPDMRRELEAGLPLEDDDHHVLLVELNPAQLDAPVDWFHGLRPLQVWIRASDLAAKRFDHIWCLIRTDA